MGGLFGGCYVFSDEVKNNCLLKGVLFVYTY